MRMTLSVAFFYYLLFQWQLVVLRTHKILFQRHLISMFQMVKKFQDREWLSR